MRVSGDWKNQSWALRAAKKSKQRVRKQKRKITPETEHIRNATPAAKRYAKVLRARLTPSEKHLWKSISSEQLGFKFRQQHPRLNYILDFYAPQHHLAVEIDGGYHFTPDQQKYDAHRTYRLLTEANIRVIRFTNEQVFKSLAWVLRTIREQAGETAKVAILPAIPKGSMSPPAAAVLCIVGGDGHPGTRDSKVNAQAELLSESA